MEKTVVDTLYEQYKKLLEFLLENSQPSYAILVEDNMKKNLILASSSYFEYYITDKILNHFSFLSNQSELVTEFIRNKAISRQYHTYFNWTDTNANSFFGLFGHNFSTYMKAKVKTDESLNQSIKAFLELGGERNKIVHQNFASYNVNKTIEEIFNSYITACYFIERIERYLKQEL
jgi:hypothetical protein